MTFAVPVFLVACLFLLSVPIRAQTIRLKNGRTIEGEILSVAADKVSIKTVSGIGMTVPKEQVDFSIVDCLKEARQALANNELARAASLCRQALVWEPKSEEAKSLQIEIEKAQKAEQEAKEKGLLAV